jgi:hypothetical protein
MHDSGTASDPALVPAPQGLKDRCANHSGVPEEFGKEASAEVTCRFHPSLICLIHQRNDAAPRPSSALRP